MDPSNNEKYITEWNRLKTEEIQKFSISVDFSSMRYLWVLAIKIYRDGAKEGLDCGRNMVRILDTIELYNRMFSFKVNLFGVLVYPKFKVSINENIHTLLAIIRNAIKTCCYFQHNTPDIPDTPDIPEVFTNLVLLKKEDEPLFKKYVDEILEDKEDAVNLQESVFVLHSGFKKAWMLGYGPKPKSNDKDGVFICKLRSYIRLFLIHYRIKYDESERFASFNVDCANALSQDGGRSSRRRKAYKTTRRNNKNKKQYRRKRHTKRCKKPHHKSRR